MYQKVRAVLVTILGHLEIFWRDLGNFNLPKFNKIMLKPGTKHYSYLRLIRQNSVVSLNSHFDFYYVYLRVRNKIDSVANHYRTDLVTGTNHYSTLLVLECFLRIN
jgi:hypothetical protein